MPVFDQVYSTVVMVGKVLFFIPKAIHVHYGKKIHKYKYPNNGIIFMVQVIIWKLIYVCNCPKKHNHNTSSGDPQMYHLVPSGLLSSTNS